jgi:ribonuclease HI
MAYGNKKTTNNLAEFQGLKHGLREAAKQGWHPLVVTGDSKMTLQLCREGRSPRNAKLRAIYAEIWEAAEQLYVVEWVHHYRRHNKMADLAANIAMDSGMSFQVHLPNARPQVADIVEWLNNDISIDLERAAEEEAGSVARSGLDDAA